MSDSKTYSQTEVLEHRTAKSCWVVLYGEVYDVTNFLEEHPGGIKAIVNLAGSDATEDYDPIHPPGTLEESLADKESGVIKMGKFSGGAGASQTTNADMKPSAAAVATPSLGQQVSGGVIAERPLELDECLNLDDIETAATQRLSHKAWAYYFSAGDDLITKSFNTLVYQRILLRPRVFVDCTRCDTSVSLLKGLLKPSVPFFVAPAAMARLGHPDGEAGIARACAQHKALQIISHNASQTPEQIVAGCPADQVFGWQIYVQTDRAKSERTLARINKLPNIKFIVLTLDAPVPGKREHDERKQRVGAHLPVPSATAAAQSASAPYSGEGADHANATGGIGKAIFAGTAADLTWRSTLPWLRQHTDLPIVLKGLQTHEDAELAAQHSDYVAGIILSNHGGRALDTAPPAIHTLLEIRQFCPHVFEKVDVWVDGGIKRGTDVVKALALGAKAVGLGRAPLFGLGAGGQRGVAKVLEIMRRETETAMRLLGVERVEDLGRRHVNARAVEAEIFDGRVDDVKGVRSRL